MSRKGRSGKRVMWEIMPKGFPFTCFYATVSKPQARYLCKQDAGAIDYDIPFEELPGRRRRDLDDLVETANKRHGVKVPEVRQPLPLRTGE